MRFEAADGFQETPTSSSGTPERPDEADTGLTGLVTGLPLPPLRLAVTWWVFILALSIVRTGCVRAGVVALGCSVGLLAGKFGSVN